MKDAIEALHRPGAVVLYPTETLYGIGGRASDVAAAHRIGELKGRGLQPLIVLVGEVPEWLPPVAQSLAKKFWPGPLTLVVPGAGRFPEEILGDDGGVALRLSPHPVVQKLVAAVGPITSTSANRTGEPPITEPGLCTLDVDATVDVGLLSPAPASSLYHLEKGFLREGLLAPGVRAFLSEHRLDGLA